MKKILLLFILIIFTKMFGYGQMDKTESDIRSYFSTNYISDGQIYRVMLNQDETGEFQATFFSNIRYRLAFKSTLDGNNKVIYRLLDSDRNVIFSNNNFDNSPYWDFQFSNTMHCIIEVEIAPGNNTSAIVLMMIGYRQ